MDIVQVFTQVRDIPYHCPESIDDTDHSCWGKHRILFQKMSALGVNVRFRVCDFRWTDQRIPIDITSKSPEKSDVHLYIEINVNKKWIILDCSHDSKLPSFNEWAGKSDCKISVNYLKIYSPEESKKIEQKRRMKFRDNFDKYKEFLILLNQHYIKLRSVR